MAPSRPITVAVSIQVLTTARRLRDRLATGGFDGYNAITGETGQVAAADDSSNSHGTRVAGIIAAEANNGLGIAGVAGGLPVSILPVKALDQNGYGTMLQVANAIRWAADHGARVINLSLGARLADFPATLSDAVRYAQYKGVLIVASVGNDALQYGGNVQGFYPACLPGVLAGLLQRRQELARSATPARRDRGSGVNVCPPSGTTETDWTTNKPVNRHLSPRLPCSGNRGAPFRSTRTVPASEVAAAIHSASRRDLATVPMSRQDADLHGAWDANLTAITTSLMLEPAEGAV